jgi:hypothetical protein
MSIEAIRASARTRSVGCRLFLKPPRLDPDALTLLPARRNALQLLSRTLSCIRRQDDSLQSALFRKWLILVETWDTSRARTVRWPPLRFLERVGKKRIGAQSAAWKSTSRVAAQAPAKVVIDSERESVGYRLIVCSIVEFDSGIGFDATELVPSLEISPRAQLQKQRPRGVEIHIQFANGSDILSRHPNVR